MESIDDEKKDIKHCDDSSYKYYIHFVSGQTFKFEETGVFNTFNAVRIKNIII